VSRLAYRHELKYLIGLRELALIRVRIGPILRRDNHVNGDGVYTIRSLYFDDRVNTAYNDKYSGVLDRQKYRIRIYNYSEDLVNLERKLKWNNFVTKQRASLTRRQVEEILAGNLDFLLEGPTPLHKVFYHECRSNILRPRVIVDYEREPYVLEAGTVRITFDRHVRAVVGGWNVFDANLASVELLPPEFLIMEVKFTEFLPAIVQRALPQNGTYHTAASKYVMACDRTLYQRQVDY
jgi:hypothetical protein